jgi:uncharacterized protein YgiM (DUF1202 family)
MRKAGAMTAILAATGAAITVGGIQVASADSATATAGVNIRSGPGTKYDIVGGLYQGQKITAVGKPKNGWIKVRFNGSAAYVSAEYLDLKGKNSSPGPANIYTKGTKIATTALNVRKGPSLGAKVIGYIADGQNVTLTGKQSKGFVEMLYGGQRAWVSAQYLVSSMNELPKDTGARYATADLLIRTSTDSDFKIVTTVKKGTELNATGATKNGYAQIIYNNAIRWVTAKYLSNQTVTGPSKPAGGSKDSSKNSSTDKAKPKPLPDPGLPKVVGTRYATTELLIRTTPRSDFKTITEVSTGTKLKITGKTSHGKAQIIWSGIARWVTAKYLSPTRPSAEKPDKPDRPSRPDKPDTDQPDRPALPAVVGKRYATTELLIRTTSGDDYKTVATVPTGTVLKITGAKKNGKAQIIYQGKVRWVTAQYLSKSKPVVDDGDGDSGSGNGGDNATGNKGQIALAFAKKQLGEPYVFGAEGPSSWDCSGLTLRAWQKAGVYLPRTSQQQFHVGKRVSTNNLRLGDLVFFYGPSPTHVGLYAGNGMILNAPRPGKVVEYTHISYMPVAGATRPG